MASARLPAKGVSVWLAKGSTAQVAALSSAGGIAPKGRPKHISVVRVVNNEVLAKEIDFDAFVQKHDVSQNVWLRDGDMIYVPRSGKIILSEDVMPILSSMLVWHNVND